MVIPFATTNPSGFIIANTKKAPLKRPWKKQELISSKQQLHKTRKRQENSESHCGDVTEKGRNNAAEVIKTFMTKLIDWFSEGQKRWARDPKKIQRDNHVNSKKPMLSFNCELPACAIRKFKSPKDYNRIRKNLYVWKPKRGLDTRAITIYTTEHIAQTESNEELLEIMLNIVNDKDQGNNDLSSEYVLYNNAVHSEEQDANIQHELSPILKG